MQIYFIAHKKRLGVLQVSKHGLTIQSFLQSKRSSTELAAGPDKLNKY